MTILDTCAMIWLVDSPFNLPKMALKHIQDCDSLAVLPISALELALKCRSGGIIMGKVPDPLTWYREAVIDYSLNEILLNADLLCASVRLPPIHRDPCDRMIIAAALKYKCPVITADNIFKKYPGLEVIW